MLFADLTARVAASAPLIPDITLERYLRDTTAAYFRATSAWRFELTDVDIPLGGSVDLTNFLPSSEAVVTKAMFATYAGRKLDVLSRKDSAYKSFDNTSGDTPQAVRLVGSDLLVLPAATTPGKVLSGEFAATTSIFAQEFPDELLEEHLNGVVSGVLARLYAIPGQPWTSTALASGYQAEYDAAIVFAKRDAEGDDQEQVRSVRYGGI